MTLQEHDLLNAMIDLGFITETEALDKKLCADLLGQMIDNWSSDWKKSVVDNARRLANAPRLSSMNKPVSFISPPNGSADFARYAALILKAGSLGGARRLAEADTSLSPRVRSMLSTKAVGAATASELVAAAPGFLSASTEFLARS